MSYDLSVYAPTLAPLEKAELRVALRQRGWDTIFLQPDAFWNAETWPILNPAGELEHDVLLGGWPLKSEWASEADKWAQERNFDAFKQLAEKTHFLATCSLSVTSPFVARADFDDKEWAEMKRDHTSHAALLERTHTLYSLTTSGGRSLWAIDFQHAVCDCIAQISGGESENPQGDLPDWEELTGEKMGLILRFKTSILHWRLARERHKLGI